MGVKSTLEQWTIDRVHREIHEGELYIMGMYLTLTDGELLKLSFVTGNKYVHLMRHIVASGPAIVSFYESSNFVTTAGLLSSVNMHRGYDNSALMQCYTASSVTNGTLLLSRMITGTTGGGTGVNASSSIGDSIRTGSEWVLNKNSKYTVTIMSTAKAAVFCNFEAEFYEESGIDG